MKTETIDFKVAHLRNFDPYAKRVRVPYVIRKQSGVLSTYDLSLFFRLR